MMRLLRTSFRLACLVTGLALLPALLPAQSAPSTGKAVSAPIPDISTLMREVEANQKQLEVERKDYTYHAHIVIQNLDKNGNVTKTGTEDHNIFYVNGQEIDQLLQRNGQPLSARDEEKEQKRVDKQIAKARKGDDKDDPNKQLVLTISRMLELGTVSNPRRVLLHGRSTIAFDYTGSPRAKTHNLSDAVMKDLVGTIWVDEAARHIVRLKAHFEKNFHIAGGLLVNVQKNTHFAFEQGLVNNEVWLPTLVEIHGGVRFLLVKSLNQDVRASFSDYRKFQSQVTILPGVKQVQP